MLIFELMALTVINNSEPSSSVSSVSSNENMVRSEIHDSQKSCLCENQCLCHARTVVPLAFNWMGHLKAFMRSSEIPTVNPFYPWQVHRPQVEAPSTVTSSDMVVNTYSQRSRNRTERTTPSPVSPPVTTSCPPNNDQDETGNLRGRNNKGKKYVCNVCGRSFDYKHVLQNHERTHTGEKPFGCTQCDKRFTRDHHLKTHMRLHTGEKPYRCEHCFKQFVQVANLRRHTRTHTGERPYECPKCPSKFSDSNQLKAHHLIHTGKKPFKCEICHGSYRRKHHLNNHRCVNFEREATTSPVQEEPEDLSIKRDRSHNNNNDSGAEISS